LLPRRLPRGFSKNAETASIGSPDLGPQELDRLERDLHWDCVLAIKNRRLVDAINQNHLPFSVNRQFAAKICHIQAEPIRSEHRLVFDCLLLKSPTAAAAALEKHITAAASRTRSRLKVLSILKDVPVAPYLVRSS
jgi:DNA-binding GntR family transcriptional regulator